MLRRRQGKVVGLELLALHALNINRPFSCRIIHCLIRSHSWPGEVEVARAISDNKCDRKNGCSVLGNCGPLICFNLVSPGLLRRQHLSPPPIIPAAVVLNQPANPSAFPKSFSDLHQHPNYNHNPALDRDHGSQSTLLGRLRYVTSPSPAFNLSQEHAAW